MTIDQSANTVSTEQLMNTVCANLISCWELISREEPIKWRGSNQLSRSSQLRYTTNQPNNQPEVWHGCSSGEDVGSVQRCSLCVVGLHRVLKQLIRLLPGLSAIQGKILWRQMLKSGGKSGKYCSAVERVIAPRNYEYDPILSVDFASKQLTEHVISLPPPLPPTCLAISSGSSDSWKRRL